MDVGTTVTLAYVLVSSTVTVHVLLDQRDVGASIGWIRLAWLSPLIGAVLYLLVSINRVRRRAHRLFRRHRSQQAIPPAAGPLLRNGHLNELEIAVRGITRRPAVPGTAIRALTNGDAAYPLMLNAIDSTVHSIGLSSYIFREDDTGQEFIERLARRGAAPRRGRACHRRRCRQRLLGLARGKPTAESRRALLTVSSLHRPLGDAV